MTAGQPYLFVYYFGLYTAQHDRIDRIEPLSRTLPFSRHIADK